MNFGQKTLLFDKIFPEMKEIGPRGGVKGGGASLAPPSPDPPIYLDIQLLSELFSKGFIQSEREREFIDFLCQQQWDCLRVFLTMFTVSRRELLRELFSPHNRENWVHKFCLCKSWPNSKCKYAYLVQYNLIEFFRIEFYRIYRICRRLFLVISFSKLLKILSPESIEFLQDNF